jgi:hypothetical protein
VLKRAEVLITYVLSGFWFEHIVTPDPSLSPLKKLRVAARQLTRQETKPSAQNENKFDKKLSLLDHNRACVCSYVLR